MFRDKETGTRSKSSLLRDKEWWLEPVSLIGIGNQGFW